MILLTVLASCEKVVDGDAVYVFDGNTAVKIVDCNYLVMPTPCGGDIVTIEKADPLASDKYNFVKISPSGNKTVKEFSYVWTLNLIYDEDRLDDEEYKNTIDFVTEYVSDHNGYPIMSSGMYNHVKFCRTESGDFVLTIIDNETEGNYNGSRIGIIKFNADGDVVSKKLDYNVDLTCQKHLVEACCPLDDGGYIFFYRPVIGDDDEPDDEPDLFMSRFDNSGNEISKAVLDINDVLNNCFAGGGSVLIQAGNTLQIIDLDGNIKNPSVLEDVNVSNVFFTGGNFYVSYSDYDERYVFAAFDTDGDEVFSHPFGDKNLSAVIVNAFDLGGGKWFSGFALHASRWASEPFDFTNNSRCDALVVRLQGGGAECDIIETANAAVAFSIVENSDGTFTVFYETIESSNTWMSKIYIYRATDLSALYLADKGFLYEDKPVEDSNSDNDYDN